MLSNAHCFFSPSASSRWLKCPASLLLEKKYTRKPSPAMNEGTIFHEQCAKVLNDPFFWKIGLTNLQSYLKTNFEFYNDHLYSYCFFILLNVRMEIPSFFFECFPAYEEDHENVFRKLISKRHINIEKRVNFEVAVATKRIGIFGTIDFFLINENYTKAFLFDLKYGKNVEVRSENNTQLMIYALGVIKEFPSVEKVVLNIYQPRIKKNTTTHNLRKNYLLQRRHVFKGVNSNFNYDNHWEVTSDYLLTFAEEVLKPVVAQVINRRPHLIDKTAGDHCMWCLHRHNCDKYFDFNQEKEVRLFNKLFKKSEE